MGIVSWTAQAVGEPLFVLIVLVALLLLAFCRSGRRLRPRLRRPTTAPAEPTEGR